MRIDIVKAQATDAQRLAEVFNRSFYSDFLKYGECPGYGKTEKDMLDGMKKYIVYKILADGETVGAISVKQESEGHYFLGALCVIPEFANQGIGQTAMGLLDKEFSAASHWALETPSDKSQNHYFYKKLGYEVTKEYMDGGVKVSYFERQV
ncbi:MAG: GNAT family N-acetyltransferase [Lachnospiraceae bacterium]|nr:GNAT family N-acetyltransferase [Lachnospiraceae bacterium]